MSYDSHKNGFGSVPDDGGCDNCPGDEDVQEVEMEIFGRDETVWLCRSCRVEMGYEEEPKEEENV